MINKAIVETAMKQLPENFTLGTLIDQVITEQEAQNWIVYYNPIVMTDATMSHLTVVKMHLSTPILSAEAHIEAIRQRVKTMINVLIWQDDDFDKNALYNLRSNGEYSLSNFKSHNVEYPIDLYEEIIHCDNFIWLESKIRKCWKGIDFYDIRNYSTNSILRKEYKEKIDNLALYLGEGVAIFNEHLASIFAEEED